MEERLARFADFTMFLTIISRICFLINNMGWRFGRVKNLEVENIERTVRLKSVSEMEREKVMREKVREKWKTEK